MPSVQPYQIDIPQSQLDHVHKKLELTTLPDELDDAGWSYGAPLSNIKRLLAHWQNSYDWRQHEKRINDSLTQYTTDIDVDGFGTLNIHFVHHRSDVTNAIPLLFCHGWPGHFFEGSKIVSKLVQGGTNQPAFHVVMPSLPNFGFSEGVSKKGFGHSQYAEVCHKLMMRLGYDQYGG
ncbi:MAG: hypothetical protein Q9162_000522 [Coniocarpon cinnabarinum]